MDYWSELDLNKVDELNAADLVIMNRSTISGDLSNYKTIWDGVVACILT
jgi:hypothetical protein